MEVVLLKKNISKIEASGQNLPVALFSSEYLLLIIINVNDVSDKKLYILVSLELYFTIPPSDILWPYQVILTVLWNLPAKWQISHHTLSDLSSNIWTFNWLVKTLHFFFIRLFCKPNSFELLFALKAQSPARKNFSSRHDSGRGRYYAARALANDCHACMSHVANGRRRIVFKSTTLL